MYSISIVNKLLQHKVTLISKITWTHQHNFFTITVVFYYIITNVNYQGTHFYNHAPVTGTIQLAITPASKSIGRRAFGVTGPIIWNEPTPTLRDAPSLTLFKRHLKTYLFKRTYGAN